MQWAESRGFGEGGKQSVTEKMTLRKLRSVNKRVIQRGVLRSKVTATATKNNLSASKSFNAKTKASCLNYAS